MADTDPRNAISEAFDLIERHAEGEAADAGFDGGEFSGPAHAAQVEKGLDAIAARYNMTREALESLLEQVEAEVELD